MASEHDRSHRNHQSHGIDRTTDAAERGQRAESEVIDDTPNEGLGRPHPSQSGVWGERGKRNLLLRSFLSVSHNSREFHSMTLIGAKLDAVG